MDKKQWNAFVQGVKEAARFFKALFLLILASYLLAVMHNALLHIITD